MQRIAVRNRALDQSLRTCLASLEDVLSESDDAVTKAKAIDAVNSEAAVRVQDFCAIRYQVEGRIGTDRAVISLGVEFPAALGLNVQSVLSDLAPVLEAASLTAQPTGETALTLYWQVEPGKRSRDAVDRTVHALSHIRYHVLACGLRRHFQRTSGWSSSSRVHHLHPRLSVLAVEREHGVLVVIPLLGRDAAYNAYLQNLVNGFSQQQHRSGPSCAFWEAKSPPEEVRPFPALCAAGTAGFMTFTILLPREPSDATLESALHCLVFFQDFVDAAMLSCKLLTKARMRAKFASYQRMFDANRAQPQQI